MQRKLPVTGFMYEWVYFSRLCILLLGIVEVFLRSRAPAELNIIESTITKRTPTVERSYVRESSELGKYEIWCEILNFIPIAIF